MEQNENNHSSNHGYVYILSNPGMPGLLKIGMTRFDPTRRVQELSSATGVPTPFQLVYYREFHDCVAAELEIHSIFATKGLRYNDQREFFSVDTVEAINTLLSLDDEEIANNSSQPTEVLDVENYNADINWDEYYKKHYEFSNTFCNSKLYQEWNDFFYSQASLLHRKNAHFRKELQNFIDRGIYNGISLLAIELFPDNIDKRIQFILEYAKKGYISGYIVAIEEYLDSIDGIENLDSKNKLVIATYLDSFAKHFKNASEFDIHIDQDIVLYCGISKALGFQYDKSMLGALDLEDDSDFNNSWLWGFTDNIEQKCKVLGDKLRADKDAYYGTSSSLNYEIINDEKYKKYHTQEGKELYTKGIMYGFGIGGVEQNTSLAKGFFYKAINEGCKKSYCRLTFFAYQDEEEFMNIIHKGIADSCPQCLMLAVDRILNGIIVEEDLTKKIRNKINRYLDLFASQMDLAFWVDAEECLNAIKIFVTSSIALNRKYNKDRIKNIIHKIKAISELDIDLESFYDTNDMIFLTNFDDYELIAQEATCALKELIEKA